MTLLKLKEFLILQNSKLTINPKTATVIAEEINRKH